MPQSIHYEMKPDPALNPTRDMPPDAFENVVLSVIKFDPSQGEQIFLSYSKERERGPGIRRSGDHAPSMRRFWDMENPWGETTDPDEQRIGTWFTDEARASQEREEWEKAEQDLEQAQDSGKEDESNPLERRLSVLRQTGDLAQGGMIHAAQFQSNYQEYEPPIGQQGCGDLTILFAQEKTSIPNPS